MTTHAIDATVVDPRIEEMLDWVLNHTALDVPDYADVDPIGALHAAFQDLLDLEAEMALECVRLNGA